LRSLRKIFWHSRIFGKEALLHLLDCQRRPSTSSRF
jgi:hypothetical protein